MNLLQFNFGIIAQDPITKAVLHFIGFQNHPEERDFDQIQIELMNDTESGLVGQPFELRRASTQEVFSYRELITTPN